MSTLLNNSKVKIDFEKQTGSEDTKKIPDTVKSAPSNATITGIKQDLTGMKEELILIKEQTDQSEKSIKEVAKNAIENIQAIGSENKKIGELVSLGYVVIVLTAMGTLIAALAVIYPIWQNNSLDKRLMEVEFNQKHPSYWSQYDELQRTKTELNRISTIENDLENLKARNSYLK
jgi:hypothetical protein